MTIAVQKNELAVDVTVNRKTRIMSFPLMIDSFWVMTVKTPAKLELDVMQLSEHLQTAPSIYS